MGYFRVRYDYRVVNYNRRGKIGHWSSFVANSFAVLVPARLVDPAFRRQRANRLFVLDGRGRTRRTTGC